MKKEITKVYNEQHERALTPHQKMTFGKKKLNGKIRTRLHVVLQTNMKQPR